ncbi:MAG: preprotein translocase subunit SecG [Candidatus Omnitrophica bacterium]|nr:preprotein translocase subunit SecG [Candidatus Omnitrophota bacterium]
MYILVLIVHLFVSLVLIAVILLQAGRGGGLADMFGGGSAQSALGTRASAYLTKATTVCAVVFLFSSLTLAVLSSRQGRSIMERNAVRLPKPAPVAPPQATTTTTSTQPAATSSETPSEASTTPPPAAETAPAEQPKPSP